MQTTAIPSTALKGYLVLSAVGLRTQRVPVSDAAQTVAIWSKWRDSNGLGASDLKQDSGNLVNENGTVVAKVSYNGKIWDYDGSQIWSAGAIVLYDPYAQK